MTDLTINAKTGGDFVLGSISFAPAIQVPGLDAAKIASGDLGTLVIKAPEPKTKGLDIGDVRAALFDGKRVAREGWNGKRMYLELQVPDAYSKMTLPYVFMFTADGHRVPWLCSQTDLLAQDWEIVS